MLDAYFRDTDNSLTFSHSDRTYPDPEFHLHNQFEIYFFIAGDAAYFVEKQVYRLHYGDLLVLNNHEIHKPSFKPGELYERITIHFDPAVPRAFNYAGLDLLGCFLNRPSGEQNKISLRKKQIADVAQIMQRIENVSDNPVSGAAMLKLTYFIELLVYLNRVFMSIPAEREQPNVPENLLPILSYIDANLGGDLSLQFLENHFYMNRYHISHLFKKTTGSNLHEYIVYKRISLAKKLLAAGFNVTDVCQMAGFNDYANFIRTFKRTVGAPPGAYQKSLPG